MSCQPIITFIQQHYGLVLVIAGYIFVAAVNNLPEPGQFKFYPWFRNTLLTIINAPVFKRLEPLPVPTPPAPVAPQVLENK